MKGYGELTPKQKEKADRLGWIQTELGKEDFEIEQLKEKLALHEGRRRVLERVSERLVTELEWEVMKTCPHCRGKGEIPVVIYPASGAEIETQTCGVCKGDKTVSEEVYKEYMERLFCL